MTLVCKECNFGRALDTRGRCVCKEGTYENSYAECMKCNIPGCLACNSDNFCLKCDTEDDYYFVGAICKKDPIKGSYLYLQNLEGIVIQLSLGGSATSVLDSLTVSIQNIKELSLLTEKRV